MGSEADEADSETGRGEKLYDSGYPSLSAFGKRVKMMENTCYDTTFLWLVTYFSSAFVQGKNVDEIAFWAAVFTVVGDQLALVATGAPTSSVNNGTDDPEQTAQSE